MSDIEFPWYMCRVYFEIKNLDEFEENVDDIIKSLPKNWKFREYGPRNYVEGYVAFIVKGIPTVEDGEKVKELLAEFV